MSIDSPPPYLPPLPWLKRFARLWMGATLLISDLLAFSLAGGLLFAVRALLGDKFSQADLDLIHLLTLTALAAFGLRGLYPGVGLSPVTEIRHLVLTFSALSLALAGLSYLLPGLAHLPRPGLGLLWLAGLGLLPALRIVTRYTLSRYPAWGEPVLLMGGGARVQTIYEHLHKRRMLGFDPLMISTGQETLPLNLEHACIELEQLLQKPQILGQLGIRTALISAGTIPEPSRSRLLRLQGSVFARLIKIPDQQDLSSLGTSPLDLDGLFAYEIRQNLSSAPRRAIKRLLDLALTLLGGLLILPLLLLLAVLVKTSSPGPVFYKQTRIGKDGQTFKAWKFRTMVANAEKLLDAALKENPELLAEWQATQKLKNDPRITGIGRILRKLSLDELPQLINVLRGEMSLVGPRPIVNEEIKHYGDDFDLYTAVQPGITGLWQVSGRNGTTYAERVRLDAYYVRNWSLWMDAYILFKTFWVVIKQDGAY